VVTVGDKRVDTEKYRVPSSKARPSVTIIGLYVYDTKDEFNRKWTQKLSDQLNLAHVARKKYEKEESKANTRQCPLSPVQVQDIEQRT